MKHLTEEQLVEQYFEEAPGWFPARARRHLAECSECAAAYARLKNDLTSARRVELPECGPDYGEQMRQRVMPLVRALPPERVRAPRFAPWRGLSYAAGLVVLVWGAFYLGRVWEHRQQPQIRGGKTSTAVEQHVVVVVLGDHLDRSERLLVELKHVDTENPELVAPLRDEARSLVASNRVFREDADKSDDHELMQALDRLDQLLNQLANEPAGLNADTIARLRQEMNTDGLLFEVRVLRSKNPHRQRTVRVVARGGAA